jgi:hypothetical protein
LILAVLSQKANFVSLGPGCHLERHSTVGWPLGSESNAKKIHKYPTDIYRKGNNGKNKLIGNFR